MPFFWVFVMLMPTAWSTQQFTNIPESTLPLLQTVQIAIESDPWLVRSQHYESALQQEAMVSQTLPDPTITLMAGNFPTDTFDLQQEAMTQLSVGISQRFPRGDSLSLTGQQKKALARQQVLLRQDRQKKVTSIVTNLWLDAYQFQESIRLIQQDRTLFEHLIDATQASYSSASGRARQQDIIRAQLELTRLDDRLTQLQQQREMVQQQMAEWIGHQALRSVSHRLPDLTINHALSAFNMQNEQTLYELIRHHPALQAYDQRIAAMETGVTLSKQKYKPEWGISAQYGYRDEDPLGQDRADLFSIGVSFDLPIFTQNRQDKDVQAAISQKEAIKADKLIASRQMMTQLRTTLTQQKRLNERQIRYQQQLLPQMAEQAEAALSAYNNDDGDFAEAVRARIAQLNAKIDALRIDVQQQQTWANLHYLLTPTNNIQINQGGKQS